MCCQTVAAFLCKDQKHSMYEKTLYLKNGSRFYHQHFLLASYFYVSDIAEAENGLRIKIIAIYFYSTTCTALDGETM